jgi:homoserine O-acetyltransferase
MSKTDQTFHYNQPFDLELGGQLPGFQLQYTVLGNLNADRSNVVWVCHALTGNSDFTSWWGDLFQAGSVFDPQEYLIICANVLGGCYGSTGPLSINPKTRKQFFHSFPTLTNRDVVRAFDLLRESLGFEKIHTLIGGSLGGQQVLEWAIQKPDVFDHIIPLASNAVHSPWGIAFNEAQRLAIEADPTWKENDERAGTEGLKAARAIGMLSYRTYDTFGALQAEKDNETTDSFRAAAYQRYQGEKLVSRFNAFTYFLLSKMMDSHNVGRSRRSVEQALQSIQVKTLVVAIKGDVLFPESEVEFLYRNIPQARLEVLTSLHGHDGFLVETDQINSLVKNFYQQTLIEI